MVLRVNQSQDVVDPITPRSGIQTLRRSKNEFCQPTKSAMAPRARGRAAPVYLSRQLTVSSRPIDPIKKTPLALAFDTAKTDTVLNLDAWIFWLTRRQHPRHRSIWFWPGTRPGGERAVDENVRFETAS
jgi:hypothetical protein